MTSLGKCCIAAFAITIGLGAAAHAMTLDQAKKAGYIRAATPTRCPTAS